VLAAALQIALKSSRMLHRSQGSTFEQKQLVVTWYCVMRDSVMDLSRCAKGLTAAFHTCQRGQQYCPAAISPCSQHIRALKHIRRPDCCLLLDNQPVWHVSVPSKAVEALRCTILRTMPGLTRKRAKAQREHCRMFVGPATEQPVVASHVSNMGAGCWAAASPATFMH
jgi:hypothetical protein